MKGAKPSQLGPIDAHEQLNGFNQHCRRALEFIEEFGKQRMLPPAEYRYWRALLQELRAATSQAVIEHIDEQELSIAAAASKQRATLEKRLLK